MSADDHLNPDQFTTLYHGTKTKHVEGIQNKGLQPPETVLHGSRWNMLTSKKDEAGHFAGRGGAVLTYHLPKDSEHLWPNQHPDHPGRELRAVRSPIPSSYLQGVDYI